MTHVSLLSHRTPPVDAPPEETGWPAIGEETVWRAHVLQRAGDAVEGLAYTWLLDGEEVATGSIDTGLGDTGAEVTLPWPAERRSLEFRIHVPSDLGDPDPHDDEITVLTDALSVGFWVERGVYDWMAQEGGAAPFERWARAQVDKWNGILEGFHSAAIPNGVSDRLRLDRITVLPSGSGWPAVEDLDTDLPWTFHDFVRANSIFLQKDSPPAIYGDQTVVLHEILHFRGVSDIYAYDVHDRQQPGAIQIRDPDGRLAAGSERLPWLSEARRELYRPPFDDVLMGTSIFGPTRISELTAYGLNLVAGRRATRRTAAHGGTYFDLWDEINPYLLHLPDSVTFVVEDARGPIPGATVEVFRNLGLHDYDNAFAEDPAVTLVADGMGRTLPMATAVLRPRTDFDPAKLAFPATAVVRVQRSGLWGYAFLPLHDLNVQFIRGVRGTADHRVRVELR